MHSETNVLPYKSSCAGRQASMVDLLYSSPQISVTTLQRSIFSLKVATAGAAVLVLTIHLADWERVSALLQHHRGLSTPHPLASPFMFHHFAAVRLFMWQGTWQTSPPHCHVLLLSLDVWISVDIWGSILIKELQGATVGTNLSFKQVVQCLGQSIIIKAIIIMCGCMKITHGSFCGESRIASEENINHLEGIWPNDTITVNLQYLLNMHGELSLQPHGLQAEKHNSWICLIPSQAMS